MDQNRQEIIEKTLDFIATKGWTVEKIDFLHLLSKYLHDLFDVDYVLIDKYSTDAPDIAETVSVCTQNGLIPNMSYELKGTPCDIVIGTKMCYYESGVQQLFPKDELLVQLNVNSYIGIPLWGSEKKPIGLIAMMDNGRLSDIKTIELVLQIVAIRSAHELERMLFENKMLEWNKNLEFFNAKLEQEVKTRTDELLKEKIERQKLSFAIEQSPTAVVITDIKGSIEYVNPHFTKLSGYSASEAIGKNPRILKTGYTTDKEYSALWKTISSGGIWEGEFININKNGEKFWEKAIISPVKDEDGKITHYLAIKEDITEFKKTNQALKSAKQEAENATRLKSEFLANMSHEIRTPMNSIIGFSELLQRSSISEKHRMYVDRIARNGHSLLKLIDDILDLSKIEARQLEIQKEPSATHLIFQEVASSFSHKDDDVTIRIEIDPKLPKILVVDPLRIRQILINLMSNAVKFSEKAEVILSVKTEEIYEKNSHVNLIFSVKDNGIGIAKEQLDIIFESFRQAEGQSTKIYGGTGLGLPITKNLVELMDGTISVESELGVGSVFTVILRNIEAIKTKPQPIKKDINIILNKAKVLYVEDNLDNQEIVEAFLEEQDIELVMVNSGLEALKLLETYTPDLIFMDIQLPGLNGFETTKRIRKLEKYTSIPIIAITAFATKDEVNKFSSVFNDYLTKPIEQETLLSSISKYINPKR